MIHRNVWLGMGLGLGMTLAGCFTEVPGGELKPEEGTDTAAEANFHRVAEPIEGRYIVVLKPDLTQRGILNPVGVRANALATNYRAVVAMELRGALDGFVAEMAEEDAIELSKDSTVAYVEQDGVVHALETQDNPPLGLDRIDQTNLPLDNRYNFDHDGTGVHAYVIDTGVRATHQGLGGRIGEGFDAVNDGNGTNDCNVHGTHVSGTIGSDAFGVAKNVTIHPVRVLDCTGSGSNSGVIAGVNFVAQNAEKPAVANMSLGGGPPPRSIRRCRLRSRPASPSRWRPATRRRTRAAVRRGGRPRRSRSGRSTT
ncbi:MAG TPA: S8 family serine peptidase [Candidatus Acidoferrum sp.]|nr:S8 family serine peptidase [Candidatus Acidoferrum sp.]